MKKGLNSSLSKTINALLQIEISNERKAVLEPLILYISKTISNSNKVKLNFICTHNSRRSQLAQVWAQTASLYYGINAACFSGGVEVTAFNQNAIDAIKTQGFTLSINGETNPTVEVSISKASKPIKCFSKLYDDDFNPSDSFAAVMTCSHADENCPVVHGAVNRISVMYDDPKISDGTGHEATVYLERANQIGTEMLYVFGSVGKEIKV